MAISITVWPSPRNVVGVRGQIAGVDMPSSSNSLTVAQRDSAPFDASRHALAGEGSKVLVGASVNAAFLRTVHDRRGQRMLAGAFQACAKTQ